MEVLLWWGEFRKHVLVGGVLGGEGGMYVGMMGWGSMMMDFIFLKGFEFGEHLLSGGFDLFGLFDLYFLFFCLPH